MPKVIRLFVAVILLIGVSCDNLDCCKPNGDAAALIGDWQVYERGYSPGAGYIIEEVDEEPARILSFDGDNGFWSNYSGLENFSYYRVFYDSLEGNILSLYKTKRDMKSKQDIHSLDHSYIIEFEGKCKTLFPLLY